MLLCYRKKFYNNHLVISEFFPQAEMGRRDFPLLNMSSKLQGKYQTLVNFFFCSADIGFTLVSVVESIRVVGSCRGSRRFSFTINYVLYYIKFTTIVCNRCRWTSSRHVLDYGTAREQLKTYIESLLINPFPWSLENTVPMLFCKTLSVKNFQVWMTLGQLPYLETP